MPQIQITYTTGPLGSCSAIWLYRRNSGYFTKKDNAFVKTVNSDSTPYNRGWVTVTYVD